MSFVLSSNKYTYMAWLYKITYFVPELSLLFLVTKNPILDMRITQLRGYCEFLSKVDKNTHVSNQ